MAKDDLPPTYWAVLIGAGITKLPSPDGESLLPNQKTLGGVAPDIVTIKKYLETQSAHSKRTKIIPLIAGDCPDYCDPVPLPSYKNVVAALLRVKNEGKPGDHVYIHFSGHGTRLLPRKDERRPATSSGESTRIGPLALVLYDLCLRGNFLRSALEQMNKCQMFVTLVLDCCFSGSVLRTSNDIPRARDDRFIKYNPAFDTCFETEDPFAASPSASSDLRNVEIEDPLALLNSNGYSILAACGPDEFASDIEFPGGARRGALSYFLLDTLQTLGQCGAQITHQSLYQHLCSRFHAQYPAQTPMRYGSSGFSFFQVLGASPSEQTFVSVFREGKESQIVLGGGQARGVQESKGGRILLSAGQAHGVHDADEYIAYPYHTSERNDGAAGWSMKGPSIKMVVKVAGSLMSELVTANPSDTISIVEGTTWKARCLRSFSSRKVHIQLAQSVPISNREELIKAAQTHPFLHLSYNTNDSQLCVFRVDINQVSAFEVQDAARKPIPNLPSLVADTTGSRIALLDMLGHLATFKYFEQILKEPSTEFQDTYELKSSSSPGPGGYHDIKNGDIWKLTFRNKDQNGLSKYLAIFNFNSSWQVSNLVAQAGGGDFLVIPPHKGGRSGEVVVPMRMTVPTRIRDQDTGMGEDECVGTAEDIVKIFIMSRPTTFPSMILPSLEDGGTRGGTDQLSRLLHGLNTAHRGTEVEWACVNFQIRTSR